VGQVAALLGVSPSTVRMWGERYGLSASSRSSGGHRRYTREDVDRLRRVHETIDAGASPAAAAAALDDSATAWTAPRRGGPGGAVLAVPGGSRAARGLARAAVRLDEVGVEDTVVRVLRDQGTLAAWNEVLRPVLVAAGRHWERTGDGIEIEHLLTQAVSTALIRHRASLREVARAHPVLLAGGPAEDHILALHALRAALAERGVPTRLLGPRTPMSALAAAARRTGAAGALVWLSRPDLAAATGLASVSSAHRRLVLLIGGPGWEGLPIGTVRWCTSLDEAVDLLEGSWRRLPPAGSAGQSASEILHKFAEKPNPA
jgi:DNA-binding transcriptional MerR regulator